MVVGLPSSAAAPTLVRDHEEAQAADGSPELPQFLQQKTQIGAEAREARGSSAQRGGGHHPDAERTPRTGETEVSGVGIVEHGSELIFSPSFCFGFRQIFCFVKCLILILMHSSFTSCFVMSQKCTDLSDFYMFF